MESIHTQIRKSRAKPAPVQASSCFDRRPSSSRPRLAPLQESKEILALQAAKTEPLKDDHDAFTVVMGSKASGS